MSGDHRNLNVHGACASVTSPTTRKSTPALVSQSGIAIHTSPSGNPDENDCNATDAVRQEESAATRLCQVVSFFAGGAGTAGV